MNVTFEKIDNVNAKIAVALVADDYTDDVKKRLNELGRTRPIKGFRPGHVPFGMLKRFYGNQVTAQVVDRILGRELQKYIADNKIALLGEPLLDKDTRVDIEHETEFEFKFDLGLAPEFDLTVDKDIKVPYYNIQVTQEMIDKQNETFRKRYGKQVPGEEAGEDSLLRGSLTELNDDGTDKEGGIVVEKTVVSPQYLKSDDEKAKFVGAHVGDDVVYNPHKAVDGNITELAALFGVDKEQADVASDFRFTISEIMVNADAEMNQEFFDNVLGRGQAADEGEYFEKLKELIAGQLKNDSNYRFSLDVRQVLLNRVGELEMPDEFLKRFLLERNENADEQAIENEYPRTREQLQWHLVRGRVASQLEVRVEEEDLMRFARFVAANQFAQYGMTNLPDDVIENYAKKILADDRQRDDISERAFEDKVFAALKDHVTIDEKSVTVDEFNDLFKAHEAE